MQLLVRARRENQGNQVPCTHTTYRGSVDMDRGGDYGYSRDSKLDQHREYRVSLVPRDCQGMQLPIRNA